jgi:hypothetical protein
VRPGDFKDSWELCRTVPLECVVAVRVYEEDGEGDIQPFRFVPDAALLRYRWPRKSPWCEITVYGDATDGHGDPAGRKKKSMNLTSSEWAHGLAVEFAPKEWLEGMGK